MNSNPMSAAALERALAERLEKLLAGVGGLEGGLIERNPEEYERRFDLRASFKVPSGANVELWVDIRKDPRPSQFPYVSIEREFEQRSVKRVKAAVFAAPFISPRMSELCERHGWSWFDLSGNCHLRIPGMIHIHHTGNEPTHAKPKPKANLGTWEAARVIRALLSAEMLAKQIWTQRMLWRFCGDSQIEVSIGLINKLVRYLREESFLAGSNDRGYRVADPLGLLLAWRDSYRFDKHERQGYFSLLQGTKLREALYALGNESGGSIAYAAFSAAEFQAPHVRQPKTWLFVSPQELNQFREGIDAKLVESGENIVVLVPADDGVFYLQEGGTMGDSRLPCTNLVQTYVDLWHSGGRGQEAAEALLEQRIKPAWRALGYEL